MNVIFDNFNRFLTAVTKVAVQLLQNESSYTIAMIISYIHFKKNETDPSWYCSLLIHRSQLQIRTLKYPYKLLYIICYYKYKTYN
jgi:hypothetical protein